jgi:hypothetical protein
MTKMNCKLKILWKRCQLLFIFTVVNKKIRMKLKLIILFFVYFPVELMSQKIYSDTIIDKNITALQFYRTGFNLSDPVIALNSGEKLTLSYDEFGSQSQYYNYTFIHCNADWTPSDLIKNEYMSPFASDQISNVTYSNNTLQEYVHYELTFPNDNVSVQKSGNYILLVYTENEDLPIITKRFYVVDQKVPISVVCKQATDLTDKFKKQEIDVSITRGSLPITNSAKIKLFIKQNGRTDNMISLKPSATTSDNIIYDYDRENVFDGGSEFRGFDIKSIKYKLDHVQALENKDNSYHAYLWADKQRSYQAYESLTDLNGRQYFKTEDFDNQLAAEYVWVHFFIPMQPLLETGTLYVFGELTQWKYIPEAVMSYNPKLQGYQGALLLKQGYYNYQYMFVAKGKTVGSVEVMEGNHWETENDYTIFVYYRPDGAIADQLVGVKLINSNKAK